MSSIIFKRFKSKGPEFKGHKLASEKSRGTGKTLKRHITVISVYSSIFKIARYLNIITRVVSDKTEHGLIFNVHLITQIIW